MLTLACLWPLAALTTLTLYAGASFAFDGRLTLSSWIRLWLAVMVILGPMGTLLTLRFLISLGFEVRRETLRLRRLRTAAQADLPGDLV
ncbi:hypothetical protein [Geoalkalibacter halelectricus]|uniref:Uncharacterized protein n=1 Tax=Geoalkalibacter halelectricus TaxID=2847045 RepID=A0ABY5ZK20_9BACT|nr:hypothetical protein [Geoalkalibacter halelectricus]MDO3378995.1 hypothetical protein [Geoalkalibacter halelectricus]UWZ78809.1 hypothetical protein L9S41_14140 [Geoalkalibacter halelectricus]